MHKMKRVGQSIEGTGGALERARRLARAEQALHAVLPTMLRPHCRLANIRGGQARLLVDASTWAVRVRYLQAPICEALGVEGITVRVAADVVDPAILEPAPAPKRTLPTSACKGLEQLADGAEPGLARALRRLASHRGD